jgi:hypothetical protein
MVVTQRNAGSRGAAGGSEDCHAGWLDASEHTLPTAAFQRLTGKLHQLGPLALLYFLREIESGASVVDRLPVYAAIDPDILRALGGDKLPAPILCGVPS